MRWAVLIESQYPQALKWVVYFKWFHQICVGLKLISEYIFKSTINFVCKDAIIQNN